MSLTPLEMQFLLDCHCSPEPNTANNEPAKRFADTGVTLGVLRKYGEGYTITPKGRAWVFACLSTDCPREVFLDAQGKEIEVPDHYGPLYAHLKPTPDGFVVTEVSTEYRFKVGDEGLTEGGWGYRVVHIDPFPVSDGQPLCIQVLHEGNRGEYWQSLTGKHGKLPGFDLLPPSKCKKRFHVQGVCSPQPLGGTAMLLTILVIVLILALVGGLPTWPWATGWGYYPSGGICLVLLIILIVFLARGGRLF